MRNGNTLKKIVSVVLLVIFSTMILQAQVETKKLDRYLLQKMEKIGIPGMQASFIANGEYIWQGNYGVKELGEDDKVDAQTLFMIASCSKPVTALGVLKLSDQGKIELDDPVNNYLTFELTNPNFPDEEITIRMLLSHVSSIRDNWDILEPLYTINSGGGDSPLPLGEFLSGYLTERGKYFRAEENFYTDKPTEIFRYSNVGYALLGLIIEEVSGISFKNYMKREIFDPLGMTQSYWFLSDIPHDNIARPHDLPNKHNDITETKVLPHYGYPDYPDGQLRTTASDYARFLKVILNNGKIDGKQFVKAGTIEDFLKIQYPNTAKHQALSWNYNEFDNWIYYLLMPRLPSHTGVDPGVATVVSFDPESKNGVVIFANALPNGFLNQKAFYQEMMKKLFKAAGKAGKGQQR